MSEQFAKHIPIGSQFGELTVIEEMPERSNNGNIMYKVRCSCGKEFIKRSSDLLTNITLSCGHITSKGEYKIHNFLKEHNIIFNTQWNNNNKMLLSSGYPCRFDFAIFHSSVKENRSFCLNIMVYNIIKRKKAVGIPQKTFFAPSSATPKKSSYAKKQASLLKSFLIQTLTTLKKF